MNTIDKTKCSNTCNVDNLKGDEIVHCVILSVRLDTLHKIPDSYILPITITLNEQATLHHWTIHTLTVENNRITMNIQIDPDTTVYKMVCLLQDSVEALMKQEIPQIETTPFWGDIVTMTIDRKIIDNQQELDDVGRA